MSFIFVSHASQDKFNRVRPLVEVLIAEGETVWVDRPGTGENNFGFTQEYISRHDINFLRSGSSWLTNIQDALRKSGAVLGCLSQALLKQSEVLEGELTVADTMGKLVTCIVDDLGYDQLPQFRHGLLDLSKHQAVVINPERLKQALELWPQTAVERMPQPLMQEWEKVRNLIASVNCVRVEPRPMGEQDVKRLDKHTSKNLVNSVGMEMIWCSPGVFEMGSDPSETGRFSNETAHTVKISKGFWISKYPVTQEQWSNLMGHNPSFFKKCGSSAPVEQISPLDASEFCRKLIEKEGSPYTLPTEAQWEYACRAGSTGPYAGPDLTNLGWYQSNSGAQTHPVGQKTPNDWGIYDMHGNVWEWCLDWHEPYPDGPVNVNARNERVRRGGSWKDPAHVCRSATRIWSDESYRYHRSMFGFRPICLPLNP